MKPEKRIDDHLHSAAVARRIVGGCPECGFVEGDPAMLAHGIGCDLRIECGCGAPVLDDEYGEHCSEECQYAALREDAAEFAGECDREDEAAE